MTISRSLNPWRTLCGVVLFLALTAFLRADTLEDVPGQPVTKASLAARAFRVEKDTDLIKGGISEKYLFSDDRGSLWLFKPMPAHDAAVEEACYRLATTLGLTTPEAFSVVFQRITGSLSRIIRNHGNLRKRPPATLTPTQVTQLMELQVFDWLIGNFDTHCRNFLIDDQDRLVTIDHGLAFLGRDFFDYDIANGPRYALQSYFADFWSAVSSGKVAAHPDTVFPFIDRVSHLPEAKLFEILGPVARMRYRALGVVLKNRHGDPVYKTPDEFLFAIALRQAALRQAFEAMYAELARQPGARYRAPPPGNPVYAYAVPPLDPNPLEIRVNDETHRFAFAPRLGRRISIKATTLRQVGILGVTRAIEQRVISTVHEIQHLITPVIHGGLTSGLVVRFDFSEDLDPTLAARIQRTEPDVLKLLRERALFTALHPPSPTAATHARAVLAMLPKLR